VGGSSIDATTDCFQFPLDVYWLWGWEERDVDDLACLHLDPVAREKQSDL
jgi:hypothetical protein